jgi:type VI secretion system protein ImpK
VLRWISARMITLTLARDRRAHMKSVLDVARSASVGICDLLQDTALLVTSLASGGTVQDASAQRGYPEDIQREALVAQCGLLDEMALRHLSTEARTAWELQPMQVERFSIHDAGRRVIDCIESHLQEASPDTDLLECYATILGMGFIGRYAREGDAKRTALIAALDTRLELLRPFVEEPFMIDPATGPQLFNGLYRLVPWIIPALVCLVAIAVWIAGSNALDAQLAQFGSAKVTRR